MLDQDAVSIIGGNLLPALFALPDPYVNKGSEDEGRNGWNPEICCSAWADGKIPYSF